MKVASLCPSLKRVSMIIDLAHLDVSWYLPSNTILVTALPCDRALLRSISFSTRNQNLPDVATDDEDEDKDMTALALRIQNRVLARRWVTRLHRHPSGACNR